MKSMLRSLAGLAAVLVLSSPLSATELPLWELGLGVGGLRLPHYRGSDQSHTLVLPVPYAVYRGEILKADREGARAVLLETDRVDFDLSVSAGAPTRSSDNRAREGMDDLPPTFEIGPNLNFTLARGEHWKLDLRAPLRAAVTLESHPRDIGWVASPNLNLDIDDFGGWNLGIQAGPVYGSRRFNAHFYDVAPSEATPERWAYRSRSGRAGAQVTTALSRRIGAWWAGAFVRYDSLAGAAFEDSPLVRQREHVSVGFAVSRVLATSSQNVTVDD
jgi:outer membrane scaffolding protein for murein synthesis (MipA/OmpV family)